MPVTTAKKESKPRGTAEQRKLERERILRDWPLEKLVSILATNQDNPSKEQREIRTALSVLELEQFGKSNRQFIGNNRNSKTDRAKCAYRLALAQEDTLSAEVKSLLPQLKEMCGLSSEEVWQRASDRRRVSEHLEFSQILNILSLDLSMTDKERWLLKASLTAMDRDLQQTTGRKRRWYDKNLKSRKDFAEAALDLAQSQANLAEADRALLPGIQTGY